MKPHQATWDHWPLETHWIQSPDKYKCKPLNSGCELSFAVLLLNAPHNQFVSLEQILGSPH